MLPGLFSQGERLEWCPPWFLVCSHAFLFHFSQGITLAGFRVLIVVSAFVDVFVLFFPFQGCGKESWCHSDFISLVELMFLLSECLAGSFSYLMFGMLLGYSWWIPFSSVLTQLQEAIFIMCPFSSSGIFIIHLLIFLNMFTMSHMFSSTISFSLFFFLCALKCFLFLTTQATHVGLNSDHTLCDFSTEYYEIFFFLSSRRPFGCCCCCCCVHLNLLEYSLFLYSRRWHSSETLFQCVVQFPLMGSSLWRPEERHFSCLRMRSACVSPSHGSSPSHGRRWCCPHRGLGQCMQISRLPGPWKKPLCSLVLPCSPIFWSGRYYVY